MQRSAAKEHSTPKKCPSMNINLAEFEVNFLIAFLLTTFTTHDKGVNCVNSGNFFCRLQSRGARRATLEKNVREKINWGDVRKLLWKVWRNFICMWRGIVFTIFSHSFLFLRLGIRLSFAHPAEIAWPRNRTPRRCLMLTRKITVCVLTTEIDTGTPNWRVTRNSRLRTVTSSAATLAPWTRIVYCDRAQYAEAWGLSWLMHWFFFRILGHWWSQKCEIVVRHWFR